MNTLWGCFLSVLLNEQHRLWTCRKRIPQHRASWRDKLLRCKSSPSQLATFPSKLRIKHVRECRVKLLRTHPVRSRERKSQHFWRRWRISASLPFRFTFLSQLSNRMICWGKVTWLFYKLFIGVTKMLKGHTHIRQRWRSQRRERHKTRYEQPVTS